MTQDKYRKLIDNLKGLGSALVAFSGGVDSTFLLWATGEALGNSALAVHAVSPIHPQSERRFAEQIAQQIGVQYREIATKELEDPEFRENPPERCYFCKRGLMNALRQMASELKFNEVIEGSNADDGLDFRPGMRALKELGIRSPLAEVGLTKAEIRELSRDFGLPTWDSPSAACLASRIPYGTEIDKTRLKRIEEAERAVRQLGFRILRVRDHGVVARIEVSTEDLNLFSQPDLRAKVVQAVKKTGFNFVCIDLEGYRTGALNEVLI